jgi:hypothetical protein
VHAVALAASQAQEIDTFRKFTKFELMPEHAVLRCDMPGTDFFSGCGKQAYINGIVAIGIEAYIHKLLRGIW